MELVYYNGSFSERETIAIDIEDRGYQFGDGIYEVIRVYEGRPFMMKEHVVRLVRSAEEIKLRLHYSMDELQADLEALIQKSGLQTGIIYLQITRGVSARQHGFPSPETQVETVAYTKAMERPLTHLKQGINAALVEDIRWLRCDIKSLNLLGNVMAKQSATERNAFEAIQHRQQTVTEGSSSNVFIVQDGLLYTHPANNLILNGITRLKVIELCQELNLKVIEKEFTVQELLDADEMFLTGTTTEVMPVTSIDDTPVGSGIPGPITVKLQQAFEKAVQAV